ncbi:MAG: PKD domain-containing protein [Halioglobus sp.]
MAGVIFRELLSQKVVVRALGLALIFGASTTFSAPPAEVPGNAVGRPDFPELSFQGRSNGESAIGRLGAKLPDVAAWYRMTPAQFTKMLREDSTAWIDMKGRLLFIDVLEDEAETSELPELLGAAPFPLENTFTLHSRPGANRIIYLDFDGHETSGTQWNSSSGIDPIFSPPYTRDGDSNFSDLEMEYIQKMWRQVAEDYAPFNVDVTTEDPGEAALLRSSSGDSDYGVRVVMTQDNFESCGCGGFAYVGVFDSYGSINYKPAFVFNTSLVGAGEAITHEAGHTLGLRHDGIIGGATYYSGHGSGATGWATIMGAGYSQPLVQWSRGEYAGANNQEDDISIIRNNGAPFISDDHGDDSASASELSFTTDGTTTILSGSGLISLEDDQDVFSFVAGVGPYTINVEPASFSPNLDVLAQLRNGVGALVNESNPVDSLPALMSGTLTAGEYFLHIDGVGKGSVGGTGYSDYGSLGNYSVSGTVADAAGLVPPTAVAATDYTSDVSPAIVAFYDGGSSPGDPAGSIEDYQWDFGDGATGSGELANHIYNSPGNYQVTLTVSDNNIPPLTDNDSLTIEVLNRGPVAAADLTSPTGGTAPLNVSFSSEGSNDPDGNIASYFWNFGDSSTSTNANPSHQYSIWGNITATLTVTDNLGATDQDQVQLTIDPPAVIDQSSSSEQVVAGTLTGDHTRTHDNDGFEQAIRERESGGKKRDRHSFLEHRWNFDVSAGNSTRLDIKARQSNSSDGDSIQFSYSVDGGNYQSVSFSNTNTGVQSFNLAGNPSGQIVVRVRDSDRSGGNRALDTFYVDYLNIHTQNDGGGVDPDPTAPDAASWAASTPIVVNSTSQITLSWNDNSSDETGFRLERSESGGSVTDIDLPANETVHSDIDLNPATTYSYQIFAYNVVGDSASSGTISATTDDETNPPPPTSVVLSTRTFKQKGVKHVELDWTGLADSDATVYFNGTGLITVQGSNYVHNLNSKGGGSYTYYVCGANNGPCSDIENVIF